MVKDLGNFVTYYILTFKINYSFQCLSPKWILLGERKKKGNWKKLAHFFHENWLYILLFVRQNLHYSVQFRSVQSLSRVQLFETPWITARQASLSITNSRSLHKLMPIESVMPSSHLILCHPLLLLPPIPPSIRVKRNKTKVTFIITLVLFLFIPFDKNLTFASSHNQMISTNLTGTQIHVKLTQQCGFWRLSRRMKTSF